MNFLVIGIPSVPNEKLQILNKILNSKVFAAMKID
jgi:hypothetical protein